MTNESRAAPLWRHGVFQKLFWAHVISLIGSGISSVALACWPTSSSELPPPLCSA
jgi:hypothetical protein